MSDTNQSGMHGPIFSTELDFPGLYPQAVICALFDPDPRSTYRDTLKNMGWHRDASNQDAITRNSHLATAWDLLFEHVRGQDVFLAVPKDIPHTITDPSTGQEIAEVTSTGIYLSTNAPFQAQEKWIVSRAHSHRGRAIAWCLTVELRDDSHPTVILSPDNVLYLEEHAN